MNWIPPYFTENNQIKNVKLFIIIVRIYRYILLKYTYIRAQMLRIS